MKANTSHSTTRAVWAALLALAVSLTAPATSRAANVNWGGTNGQNITGDSDVSTVGTLIGAVHLGDDGSLGGGTLSDSLVNTVNFQALSITGFSPTGPSGQATASLGNFTLAAQPSGNLLTVANGFFAPISNTALPYYGLSSNYQAILGSGIFINGPDSISLTISGLNIGQTYQFEWWANNSGPSSENHIAQASTNGNTVTLNDNTYTDPLLGGALDGGVGQYAIGTFTADGATQVITFEAPAGDDQSAQVNAFELRAVPDSMNTVIGLGLAIAGVIGVSALDRRQRTLHKV